MTDMNHDLLFKTAEKKEETTQYEILYEAMLPQNVDKKETGEKSLSLVALLFIRQCNNIFKLSMVNT